MKNLKSLTLIAILAIFIFSSLTSCMTTKTSVGAYIETQGEKYTYAKGKQVWLFWGLVPMNRANINTPVSGNCQVITRFDLGDFLITGLTAGIVSTQSIKVKAKREEQEEGEE